MQNGALLEMRKKPRFTADATGDLVRDRDSFDDPGTIRDVLPADLDRLFHAVVVDTVSAFESRWRSGRRAGSTKIHDAMWFYIAGGDGWGWTGTPQNSFYYGPGSLLLLPPDTEHAIEPTKSIESHVFAVHFRARLFGAIDLLNLLRIPTLHRVPSEEDSFLQSSYRLAREFAQQKPGYKVVMEAEIRSVLFQLIRTAAPDLNPDVKLSALSDIPRLIPIFQHIEENLHLPALSVGEMAGRACLSEVQFRKIFRRITGDSPLRFVQRRRVERACVMLHTTTDGLSQVAEACGFADAPFFHRVFKIWTGLTPREYCRTDRP
jgi:AraC-like DNA-binding protein